MTHDEVSRIAEEAAEKALEKFKDAHPCKLSEDERHLVHALHEATVEEGANHGTWRVLIQWGVSVKDVTKKVRTAVIVILGLIVLSVVYKTWWT